MSCEQVAGRPAGARAAGAGVVAGAGGAGPRLPPAPRAPPGAPGRAHLAAPPWRHVWAGPSAPRKVRPYVPSIFSCKKYVPRLRLIYVIDSRIGVS